MKHPITDRKAVLFAVLALGVSFVAATLIGFQVVKGAHSGTSFQFLGKFLEHRDEHPVDYYWPVVMRMVGAAHLIAAVPILLFLTRRRRSPWLFLVLLLAVDVILGYLSERYGGLFSVRHDWGFAEAYQYIKELGIIALFALLYTRTRQLLYAALSALFVYLFLDDFLQYHERLGWVIADSVDLSFLSDALTVRAKDIGEVVALVLPVALLAPPLLLGYLRADRVTALLGRRMFYALAALGFFGVALDVVTRMTRLSPELTHQIGFVEDFGEMVCMTVMLVLAVSALWNEASSHAASP